MAETRQPDESDEYGVAHDAAPAAGPSLPSPMPDAERAKTGGITWYLGSPSGQREGPLPEAVVKQRLADGNLSPETLVWREGESGWAPARTVPELFVTRPGVPGMPPPMPPNWTAVQADVVAQVTTALANPVFYRMAGWAAAGLAVLFLMASILLALWHHTWLIETGVFVVLFFVCQATAAILDSLRRIEPGRKDPNKNDAG
jgi:hypothetical protein